MHLRRGVEKPRLYRVPRKRANLAYLVLSLDSSFGSLGNVPFNKWSQMGSIQHSAVITGKISSLLMFIEGSGRCSTGICLSKSSGDVVANFAKASAYEFSTLRTCLT